MLFDCIYIHPRHNKISLFRNCLNSLYYPLQAMVMVTVCKLLGACDHYRNTLCGCAKGRTPAYGLACNVQDKLNQQLEKNFFQKYLPVSDIMAIV